MCSFIHLFNKDVSHPPCPFFAPIPWRGHGAAWRGYEEHEGAMVCAEAVKTQHSVMSGSLVSWSREGDPFTLRLPRNILIEKPSFELKLGEA